MGAGGSIGFVGRIFGGMAARTGAKLTGNSISSVASRTPDVSGTIAGDIADRSLGNYMPHLSGMQVSGTEITGGQITAKVVGADGKETSVGLYSTGQFEKPEGPYSMVTASDGSQWYQIANGPGAGAFYDAPQFNGAVGEAAMVAATFPDAAEGTTLRTVDDGVIEATQGGHSSMWYNSAYYDEPDAPHTIMQASNGVEWYAMQQHAEMPGFEPGDEAQAYNQATFQSFMPGYDQQVYSVDGSQRAENGYFEVRHENGSGTMFYDTSQFAPPRGDYQVYEDVNGSQWYAIHGEAAVERKPVFENGKPVYDGDNVRTVNTETVRYKTTPSRYAEPEARDGDSKAPRRKR